MLLHLCTDSRQCMTRLYAIAIVEPIETEPGDVLVTHARGYLMLTE